MCVYYFQCSTVLKTTVVLFSKRPFPEKQPVQKTTKTPKQCNNYFLTSKRVPYIIPQRYKYGRFLPKFLLLRFFNLY